MKKNEAKKQNVLILPLIVAGTILAGFISLFLLQKYSVNNKYLCSYLGGLWQKKDSDQAHRCYTYEEFYK